MRKKLCGILASLCMLGMFAACSSDDPTPVTPPEPEPTPTPVVPGEDLDSKEYPSDAFEVTIGDETMPGKVAKFVAKDDGTAELTLEGAPVSLDALMGDASKADDETVTIPTPGVIPGSPSVTLSLTLEGEGANCTFSGSHETDYCTFSYNGSVTTDKLSLNITDLKLKDTSFAGTYDFVPNLHDPYISPTNPDYVPSSNSSYAFESTLRIVWEATQWLFTMGTDYGTDRIGDFLGTILESYYFNVDGSSVPNASVMDMFSRKYKSITLTEAGDFLINLNDEAKDADNNGIIRMQYVVTEDNSILLFAEPQTIMNSFNSVAEVNRKDVITIFKSFIDGFLSHCQDGIPVKYGPSLIFTGQYTGFWPKGYAIFQETTDPNQVSFYLDTDFLNPILQTMAADISADPEYYYNLVDNIDNPTFQKSQGWRARWAIYTCPAVFETTTKVQLGFNFTKQ